MLTILTAVVFVAYLFSSGAISVKVSSSTELTPGEPQG